MTGPRLRGMWPVRRPLGDQTGDEPTRASQLTSAEVQAGILRVLTKPLFKQELSDRLGVNEGRILRELQDLRRAGRVRVIGHKLAERRWALVEAPATPRVAEPPRRRGPRPRSVAERYADLLKD